MIPPKSLDRQIEESIERDISWWQETRDRYNQTIDNQTFRLTPMEQTDWLAYEAQQDFDEDTTSNFE